MMNFEKSSINSTNHFIDPIEFTGAGPHTSVCVKSPTLVELRVPIFWIGCRCALALIQHRHSFSMLLVSLNSISPRLNISFIVA